VLGVTAPDRYRQSLRHLLRWRFRVLLMVSSTDFLRRPNAINNAGVVVGTVDGPGGSAIGPNAFVYEKGKLRLIDECGASFTSATAINDAGQVAGIVDKEDMAGADARGVDK
jgi:hypothetical protein